MGILDSVNYPRDIKKLPLSSLNVLCSEIRQLILDTVLTHGGAL